jgi:hypothetical protein
MTVELSDRDLGVTANEHVDARNAKIGTRRLEQRREQSIAGAHVENARVSRKKTRDRFAKHANPPRVDEVSVQAIEKTHASERLNPSRPRFQCR